MTHRFFAALSVLACATANAKTIEGQVFIVTAGGPAIKLALVEVKAISKIEMENHIAKIEQQIAPERAEVNSAVSRAIKESDAEITRMSHKPLKDYQKEMTDDLKKPRKERFAGIDARFRKRHQLEELRARQRTLNSAAPFFVDLPQSIATAKTDADGRFALTIPDKGEYVLVASAERTVVKAEDDLVKKQIRKEDAFHDTERKIADNMATGNPFASMATSPQLCHWDRVKYWEIIQSTLKKRGWNLGYVSTVDPGGRT